MQEITGGERVGGNLFHSFDKFSVPTGREAIFRNDPNIRHIFTRITGGESSLIDGLVQTQGEANLFLINPNGIVFGENARLDMGGSFIATTADHIKFADGTEFSSRDSKVSFTNNIPVGLGLLGNNGGITVNGSGKQITRPIFFTPYSRNRSSGLSFPSGKTLALIGKEINLNGGVIVSNGGKIELGGVNFGRVELEANDDGSWKLGYQEVQLFGNVNLNKRALIDPSGGDSSFIGVHGQDITLTDNSILIVQNDKTEAFGDINLDASGSMKIIDRSHVIAETEGEVNISISAKNLLLQNSGAISSHTSGVGKGGDINIVVSERLDIINSTSTTSPGSIFISGSDASASGSIYVEAQEVRLSQGSSIVTMTLGSGKGGDITIDANLVELNGQAGENKRPTYIGSIGFGQKGADAGEVNLKVSNLKLINGAAISSDSKSDSSSGNVDVTATDSIEIIGKEPNQEFISSITSSVTIEKNIPIRLLLKLPSKPGGNAGNITIKAPRVNISQAGIVKVTNESTGDAGRIIITSNTLDLEESSSIKATAESGIGGNIELNTKNLEIGDGSQITAEAGNDGNGGNITINTEKLIAKKNARIVANAFNGRGGNIFVNAEGLFLFAPQEDIFDASSELGIDGIINIENPDNDFEKDLELSEIKLSVLPDFYTPWCDNPDRILLGINSGREIAPLRMGRGTKPIDR